MAFDPVGRVATWSRESRALVEKRHRMSAFSKTQFPRKTQNHHSFYLVEVLAFSSI
jgi:hypothetical protein